MGKCCSNVKEFYTETDSYYELKLRNFEEEKLKAFEYAFQYIRSFQVFNSNSINKKQVISFFKEHFGETMVELVSRSYFEIEGEPTLVSGQKVKALVYLLSRAEIVKGRNKNYYDKSKYLIQEVLINEEEGMNTPIELNNPNFNNFITTLIETTYEITIFYMNYQEKNNESVDKEFQEIVNVSSDKLREIFKQNLNSFQKQNISYTLSFQEIERRFSKDKWFLTPGYFRELAMLYITSQPQKNAH